MISAAGAQVVGPTSGGKVTGFNNISTTPQQVLPPDPSRAKAGFHNPGSVDIIVFPSVAANGQANTVTTSLLGGGFRVFANGGDRVVDGECQGAWNAFSVSASGNSLTAWSSNV